jgi:hypothetical protein
MTRVIRPRHEGFTAMIRSPGPAVGFAVRSTLVASPRLIQAVAASLAVGCLMLCLIVALTVSIDYGSAARALTLSQMKNPPAVTKPNPTV